MRAVCVAALLLLAGANPAPFTFRADPAPPPAPAATPADVRALLFADFGDPGPQQAAVSAGLAAAAVRPPGADLAFSLGDNLYECGPDAALEGADRCEFARDGNTVEPGFTPPRDALFARLFEDALAKLPPIPVYVALGNHDVAAELRCRSSLFGQGRIARRKACLSVAHRSPRWAMPGRHYVVDRGPARFVVLDTNVLVSPYGGFDVDGEAAFLREAARTREGRLLFVLGHHPAATAGGHRTEQDRAYASRLAKLEQAAGGEIAAWIAGHDHDLQHLRSAAGYDVLVTGNSSRGRADERF